MRHGNRTDGLNLRSMNVKSLLFALLCSFTATVSAAQASPQELHKLQYALENQESELRMFEERLNNQETTIAALRQQCADTKQSQRELFKGSSQVSDSKITSLESTNKSLLADLKQLKTHANDSAAVLAQYKQKIAELEKMVASQNENIDHLKAALKAITEAIDPSIKNSISSSEKQYRIKGGDTLEKIAKAHHTTIKALKEHNQIKNDKIIVGQVLQIP